MNANQLAGRALLFPLALVLTGVLALSASAATWYVAPQGDDAAAGDQRDAAWATLTPATGKVAAGDEIVLLPGRYIRPLTAAGLTGQPDAPIVIRAAVPGFSEIIGAVRVGELSALPGDVPLLKASFPQEPLALLAWEPNRRYTRVAQHVALRAQVATYWYDPQTSRLVLHPPLGVTAAGLTLEAGLLPGAGLTIADCAHVIVRSLTVRGFLSGDQQQPGVGVDVRASRHVAIMQCYLLGNTIGVRGHEVEQLTLSDNLAAGNAVGFSAGAQLSIEAGRSIVITHNTLTDSDAAGVALGAQVTQWTIDANHFRQQNEGVCLVTAAPGRLRRNVFDQCTTQPVQTVSPANCALAYNTVIHPDAAAPDPQLVWDASNLVLPVSGIAAARFCDPEYFDYRLQADSPHRGQAPGGVDRGAQPFAGDVLFVSPDGDDAHDGLSAAGALQTLEAANKLLRPGVTLYLLPGTYAGPLKPAAGGTLDQPLLLRGRGSALPRIETAGDTPALDLTAAHFVIAQNLTLAGTQLGAVIRQSQAVTLERCYVPTTTASGIVVLDSNQVWLRRLTVRQSTGPAVILQGDCGGVRLTSSVLSSTAGPALGVAIKSPQRLFLGRNLYRAGQNAPLAMVNNQPASELAGLHRFGDDAALTLDPKLLPDEATADFIPGSPCQHQGELLGHIGAGVPGKPGQ